MKPNRTSDEYTDQRAGESTEKSSERFMEIGGPGARRSLVGFVSYALLVCGIGAVLVLLFVRFTGSMRLALALVIFMLAYMLLMGWWAGERDERSG